MKIFRSFEEAKGISNPVVTTGSFDGVHIGHKTILNRLKMLAGKYNGESVLITFDPHPRKVLYPDTAGRDLKLINSQEEKLELLRKAGLDNVIIIEFTKSFSQITSEEFVRDYLKGFLNARVIVAGFNHHFGFNKEGDYRHLWNWREKYDFEAEEIPEQEVQHETVSSTKIRKAISEGYIQRANAYLDHYYIIMGRVEDYSLQLPEGFPSLNKIPLTEECKILPATGVYAVSVVSGTEHGKGMAIINHTPGKPDEVLLNVFGNEEKLKRDTVTLLFHKMIRGSVDFSDKKAPYQLGMARAEIEDLIY
ncbi:MAG TPA: adenylyltransferase/cytidyltransferase family protein [Bacteroidales bacterium]|nr:MAG: Riboflavin biosynthesis protein RibF [Bacteroidetes bacterium ADurb.Bin145]HOU01289.1 adenylyltransferase/cytidyltransferase family protein [Bacteroidales bacterium]HQG62391.1 adenylyltransferase/cytidyltransferase family protein [Bacteroidales bacterium]HQK67373.1 adenylyltransferase/cytidyltransferase family protein [Bacteroidales bacterium]